jgi:hypothetical protein
VEISPAIFPLFSIKNNGEPNILYLISMEKAESENRKGGFFKKLRKPTRKEILTAIPIALF